MPGYIRRWLPFISLPLAIAALWAFSGETECPDSSWDGSRAIARVGHVCVYPLQFNTYLRDFALNYIDQGAEAEGSGLGEYLERRQRLITQFGLENAAFATLALDVALYQAAARRGYSAPDGDVMAVMGTNRERIRGLATLLELHELALASDLRGFRDLIESPEVQQMIPVQGEEHLLALFEEAGRIDLSGAARGMDIHRSLLEAVGEDLYWNGVFVELANWLVAVESYRLAVNQMESSQQPGLDWQDVRENAWGSTDINLTGAVPHAVTLTGARQYMTGLHALERDLLTR